MAIFRRLVDEGVWVVGDLPKGAKKGTVLAVPKKDGSIASVVLASVKKAGAFGERVGFVDYPATARYRKDGRLPEAAKPKGKPKAKAKGKPKPKAKGRKRAA